MSTTTSQEALSSGPHEHLNSRELQHHYGDRIHILENPLLSTALKRFSDPSTDPAGMLELLRTTYQYLAIDACGREFGTVETQTPTRMAETHPEAGLLKAEVLNPETNVVVVDIVRAGIVPSQVCFELLCSVLPAHQVRLDHLTLARTSDEQGRVTGVDLSGSKIGFYLTVNSGEQFFVQRRCLPFPTRLARFSSQFSNRLNNRLHFLVCKQHRTQHHFF